MQCREGSTAPGAYCGASQPEAEGISAGSHIAAQQIASCDTQYTPQPTGTCMLALAQPHTHCCWRLPSQEQRIETKRSACRLDTTAVSAIVYYGTLSPTWTISMANGIIAPLECPCGLNDLMLIRYANPAIQRAAVLPLSMLGSGPLPTDGNPDIFGANESVQSNCANDFLLVPGLLIVAMVTELGP